MTWTPDTEFTCDVCGESFDCTTDGRLEWLQGEQGECHGFRIVHDDPACRYDTVMKASSRHLSEFCGPEGLSFLLEQLAHCVEPKGSFHELLRRMQLPDYDWEQNRRFLGEHLVPSDPDQLYE
jgi:hypothetical protein